MKAYFSSTTIDTIRQQTNTLRGLRENNHQYGILYNTKKSLQNEGKIKGSAKQLLHNVL